MKYLKDIWTLNNPLPPTISYYEIDDDRRTIRLIDFFADGRIECLNRTNKDEGYIADQPFPSMEEMNKNSTKTDYICYVSKEEFEELWSKYAPK
jgi:hypothetical protein